MNARTRRVALVLLAVLVCFAGGYSFLLLHDRTPLPPPPPRDRWLDETGSGTSMELKAWMDEHVALPQETPYDNDAEARVVYIEQYRNAYFAAYCIREPFLGSLRSDTPQAYVDGDADGFTAGDAAYKRHHTSVWKELKRWRWRVFNGAPAL